MKNDFKELFTREYLEGIFPPERADRFFEALYGDIEEGAYDIELVFRGASRDKLNFEFQLKQRPGKCLVCSLTYGLPKVFARHPIINVGDLVKAIEEKLHDGFRCGPWKFAATREISHTLHALPLNIDLVQSTGSTG